MANDSILITQQNKNIGLDLEYQFLKAQKQRELCSICGKQRSENCPHSKVTSIWDNNDLFED